MSTKEPIPPHLQTSCHVFQRQCQYGCTRKNGSTYEWPKNAPKGQSLRGKSQKNIDHCPQQWYSQAGKVWRNSSHMIKLGRSFSTIWVQVPYDAVPSCFYCFIFSFPGSFWMQVCYPTKIEAPSLDEDHPKVCQGTGKHPIGTFNKCSRQLQYSENNFSWLLPQCSQVWKKKKGQVVGGVRLWHGSCTVE